MVQALAIRGKYNIRVLPKLGKPKRGFALSTQWLCKNQNYLIIQAKVNRLSHGYHCIRVKGLQVKFIDVGFQRQIQEGLHLVFLCCINVHLLRKHFCANLSRTQCHIQATSTCVFRFMLSKKSLSICLPSMQNDNILELCQPLRYSKVISLMHRKLLSIPHSRMQ